MTTPIVYSVPGMDDVQVHTNLRYRPDDSAGLLLGTGLGPDTAFVRCLLAFYAFLDIRESPLHAEEGPPELLRQYSPAAYYGEANAAVPPIFVARAGLDVPALNAVIDRFAADALKANAPLTLLNHPHGKHGFDALNDDARSREIIRAALAFMHTHLMEL